jgi:hypothetical protein
MNTLFHKSKQHWFKTVTAAAFIAIATVFLCNVFSPNVSRGSVSPNFPIYVTGNFSFSTPLQLPKPLNMVEGEIDQAAEPEIKIDIFGNIYITGIHGVPGGLDFWKSTDKGANFVYLGQPDGAQDKCTPAGPVICQNGLGGGDDSIDVSSGGYLYISSLYAGSVTMSTSYDGGAGGTTGDQAWKVNPVASSLPSDDRQWVAAYGPQTLYMTYNDIPGLNDPPGSIGLFFVKSTDGGKTFSAPVAVTAVGQTNLVNLEGNLVVDQYNGNIYTAYIPNGSENVIDVARSTDAGATWSVITAYTGPAGTTTRGVFPILAVDRGGNLHLAFTKSDATGHTNCHIFLTSSANPTAASPAWTTAVQIDTGSLNVSACLPWIVAGSPGIVDVTWLGSSAASPDTVNSNWHVFFAQVTNALTGSPTIAQNQVETPIMHNHSICFDGFACASNSIPQGEPGNRDLAEYYTMTLDPDGNANIVYGDSLNGGCGAEMDPLGLIFICGSKPWFTKQTVGPSAYAPPAAPAPATFAANLDPITKPPGAGSASGAEPSMRADSHNCLFSSAPGAPPFWKSTDAGSSFKLLAANPVVGTGLKGGDEEILPVPQISGARPDQIYFGDLGVSTVHISKSTDGGATWFKPGPGGAAGEVSVVTDRQWMAYDRNGADTTVYLWEHEFVGQELRMNALTNDMVWAPFASGMTDPELITPPSTTAANTVPGPCFADPATHRVYGFLGASTPTTNAVGELKLPNVWEADGAGTFTAGVPPGPFTNHPVWKGVIDSPASPQPTPPPGSATVGSNAANLFNGATIDSAGNIYVTWATPNARNGLYDVFFASSHDHGATYYGPFKVNPNGLQGNMPWIAAGDNGRVDIVFYGTTGTQDPTSSSTNQWNVFFAQSLNGADREPVFSVVQASDHIMHTGPICNLGILCSGGTRQLLDFFQVAIGPDGLANIAYADTGNSNGSSHVSYARQSGGPLALVNPSSVTCLPIPPVASVVSRKVQGAAGQKDILLPLPPYTSTNHRGVECRTPGQTGTAGVDYKIVFTFVNNLNNLAPGGGCGTTSTPAGTVVAGPDANQCTVNLNGLADQQYTTVTLNSVTDVAGNSGPVSSVIGLLVGDVNANGLVNSTDTSQVQAQSGQPVTGDLVVTSGNYRKDVNANGLINSTDTSTVQSKSGHGLPTPP